MHNIAKNPIQERLFRLQDKEYQRFNAKLIPSISEDTVIGVRVPILRKLALQIEKKGKLSEDVEFGKKDMAQFLGDLPHDYYEENLLHMMAIGHMSDIDEVLSELERFLPYVDNWAVCDSGTPKVLRDHLDIAYVKAMEWMRSEHPYTIRYGIVTMMNLFLDEAFQPAVLEAVAKVRSDEYYVNMATAWFFATALAKQEKESLPYIEEKRLDVWTHNKAIQKAIESYRVSDECKAHLRTLKRKRTE